MTQYEPNGDVVYWCVDCDVNTVPPVRWEKHGLKTCLECGEIRARRVVHEIVQVGNKQSYTVLSGSSTKEKIQLVREYGWRKNG